MSIPKEFKEILDEGLLTAKLQINIAKIFELITGELRGGGYHHPITCSEGGCPKCSTLMVSDYHVLPPEVKDIIRLMGWGVMKGMEA